MLVTIVTLLPLVGALPVFLTRGALARRLAMIVSLATFAASVPLWWGYDAAGSGPVEGWPTFQLVEGPFAWIPDFGVSYFVGLDGVALVLVLLTTLLTPIVIYSSFRTIEKDQHLYLGFMLVLETGMIGAFVALDVFLFYVFWELMLIPMYFIIGMWGGPNRIYAAVKFFVYTVVGSLLMLVAILVLMKAHHDVFSTWSASVFDLYRLDLDPKLQVWLFAAFALSFAIKVPMFPFHTWLPDAHVQAPTGGSVILAGVLLKLGTFGFLRYALPLFPEGLQALMPALVVLSVVGIIYGALVAMVQPDIKKLVAYSSVSHMGVVMLGLFALDSTGVSGAVYQMLNHGISTGMLFLLVGVIYERRHTREISEYGGLARVMPVYAFVFLLVTFSSIGLPGLNGFIGEVLVLLGAFGAFPAATVFAATGVVLGAVYMLWLYQRVFFGPVDNPKNEGLADLERSEIGYMLPLLALIVFMGVYPRPILEKMGPSIDRYLAEVTAPADVASRGE